MQITIEQSDLDALLIAMDNYSTMSAYRQKHMKGRFDGVCSLYAKATGLTKKQARDHLFDQISL